MEIGSAEMGISRSRHGQHALHPIHPQTLQYLTEARGMVRVETLMLHPYPEEKRLPEDSALARTFNDYFYGSQDLAVIGRRP